MAYENILFEVQDGVGVLTFNRPKALNALNPKTLEEVNDVIERVQQDGHPGAGTHRRRGKGLRGRRRHHRIPDDESPSGKALCGNGTGRIL